MTIYRKKCFIISVVFRLQTAYMAFPYYSVILVHYSIENLWNVVGRHIHNCSWHELFSFVQLRLVIACKRVYYSDNLTKHVSNYLKRCEPQKLSFLLLKEARLCNARSVKNYLDWPTDSHTCCGSLLANILCSIGKAPNRGRPKHSQWKIISSAIVEAVETIV